MVYMKMKQATDNFIPSSFVGHAGLPTILCYTRFQLIDAVNIFLQDYSEFRKTRTRRDEVWGKCQYTWTDPGMWVSARYWTYTIY
jgi:hypothetical protein